MKGSWVCKTCSSVLDILSLRLVLEFFKEIEYICMYVCTYVCMYRLSISLSIHLSIYPSISLSIISSWFCFSGVPCITQSFMSTGGRVDLLPHHLPLRATCGPFPSSTQCQPRPFLLSLGYMSRENQLWKPKTN